MYKSIGVCLFLCALHACLSVDITAETPVHLSENSLVIQCRPANGGVGLSEVDVLQFYRNSTSELGTPASRMVSVTYNRVLLQSVINWQDQTLRLRASASGNVDSPATSLLSLTIAAENVSCTDEAVYRCEMVAKDTTSAGVLENNDTFIEINTNPDHIENINVEASDGIYNINTTLTLSCNLTVGKPPLSVKWCICTVNDAEFQPYPVSSDVIISEATFDGATCQYQRTTTLTYLVGDGDELTTFMCEDSSNSTCEFGFVRAFFTISTDSSLVSEQTTESTDVTTELTSEVPDTTPELSTSQFTETLSTDPTVDSSDLSTTVTNEPSTDLTSEEMQTTAEVFNEESTTDQTTTTSTDWSTVGNTSPDIPSVTTDSSIMTTTGLDEETTSVAGEYLSSTFPSVSSTATGVDVTSTSTLASTMTTAETTRVETTWPPSSPEASSAGSSTSSMTSSTAAHISSSSTTGSSSASVTPSVAPPISSEAPPSTSDAPNTSSIAPPSSTPPVPTTPFFTTISSPSNGTTEAPSLQRGEGTTLRNKGLLFPFLISVLTSFLMVM